MDSHEKAIQQLRECITEAHGLLKDIRAEHKEIKRTLSDWKAELDSEMTEYLMKELNLWGDDLPKKLKEIEDRINARFEGITRNILGVSKLGKPLTVEELSVMRHYAKRFNERP